jgi:hypothetical protein
LRRTPVLVALALCGLFSAACAPKQDPLEVGLRRVALDLAFKDETKAEPVSPRQVVTQLQVVDDALEEEVPEDEPPRKGPKLIVVPGRKPEPPCVPAPAGAQYDVPTYAVVKDPPAVGSYTRHNTGTVKIETAAFNLDLPYPMKTNVDISDIQFVTATSYLNSDDADSLGLPGEVRDNPDAFPARVEFTMARSGPSGSKVVDTFRYSLGGATGGDFLWLIRRETTVSGVKTVFNPTPPIRYVKLFVTEGTDSEVTHAGVDRATNTALSVQSKIVGRESVDVCGSVVDTFRVQIQENFADLSQTPPVISGNENGTANFWNIQFDHGMLLVREEVHSTYRGTAEIAGAPVPVTVRYDYTSTLDALEPKAPKAAATLPAAPGGGDEPAEEEE